MFDHFMLGVNYWPRHRGLKMWKEWTAPEIEEEFKEIKELGLKVVRVFLLWQDFQPQEDLIDEQMLSFFEELTVMAKKYGLKIAPTFFVGNMSGEVWDIPWRKGRNVYKSPSLLNAQLSLVQLFAKRYKGEENIVFWDLANEPDLGFAAESAEDAQRWSKLLYREIKKYDVKHPVTLGLHQGSLFEDNKFRPQEISPYSDFMCVHAYPIYATLCPDSPDSLRSTYLPSFLCQLTSALTGKKVLLEEFGVSSQLVQEEQQRRYYESVLFSLLSNGALGALAWCFSDFSQDESSPYSSTPYEIGFGITSKEGKKKHTAEAMEKISKILEKGDFSGLRREKAKAAIMMPRHYHDNPDKEISAEIIARVLFSSYLLTKQAGLNVDFISPEAEFEKYHLIFLPAIPRRGALSAKDWHKISRYVFSGGTIYCSYNGVAFQGLEDIFGISIEHAVDVSPHIITLIATEEKPLPSEINIMTTKSKHLLLQEEDKVWMRNEYGEAAITSKSYGEGQTIFCAYPVELYISYITDVFVGNLFYRVYEEIAREAKLAPSLCTGNPNVEACVLYSDYRKVLLFTNHQSKKVTIETQGEAKNVRYKDIYSGEIISQPTIILQGNEGRALEVIEGEIIR